MNSLGKGLSALIPEIKKAEGKTPDEIEINKIKPNPHQPRKHFDELTLSELAASIKEHGILQPLIVSKTDSGYELIAGERRLKAAKKIGLKTVPAIIRTPTEQQKLELSMIENIQRHNLNPIEEATAYQKLNDHFGMTHEQIAKKIGKSRASVTNTIRLLELPQEIQEGLEKEKISVSHAKVLLEIDDENRQFALYQKIVRQNLTVRELESEIKKPQKEPPKKTVRITNPELEALEDLLRTKLGTKVRIGPKLSKGKIEIEYYSKEELDEILRRIRE
ncbi:ParB/RepB/Spo0J family partition protein [Patescibacteria group bacterium]|nr:MAG: ParB/RepB/Spo0J family partition protein [Patescibacteria group bacterium]